MREVKLKSCPFCGSEAGIITFPTRMTVIKCPSCGIQTRVHPNLNVAIESWNTRKPIENAIEEINDLPTCDYLGVEHIPKKATLNRIERGGRNELPEM